MRMSAGKWMFCLPLAALAALPGRAEAACTFGTPFGGEPTLQQALDGILSPAPDVVADCIADGVGGDALWTSVGGSSATILLEIAGFANQNVFGIYDAANPSNQLQLFSGPDGPGASASIAFTNDSGGVQVTVSYGYSSQATQGLFAGGAFGFYLRTPQGNTFFSDSSLNPGGSDQMYAYLGNGGSFVDRSGDFFGAHDVILAYEDLLNGDRDYQDFVVLVRGVQPVPLPAAAWLFLSGLAGLGAVARAGGRRRLSVQGAPVA